VAGLALLATILASPTRFGEGLSALLHPRLPEPAVIQVRSLTGDVSAERGDAVTVMAEVTGTLAEPSIHLRRGAGVWRALGMEAAPESTGPLAPGETSPGSAAGAGAAAGAAGAAAGAAPGDAAATTTELATSSTAIPGADARRYRFTIPAVDQETHYRVTVADRDGNEAAATGSFTTLPPFLHVESLEIEKAGAGPFTVTARALVVDHTGAPVVGVPVRGFWAGDLGGQAWEQEAVTDGSGRASFTLAPFTPSAPTSVTFSPAYVGSPFPSNPWFVGLGGDTPTFFYDQPGNGAHYVTIDVP